MWLAKYRFILKLILRNTYICLHWESALNFDMLCYRNISLPKYMLGSILRRLIYVSYFFKIIVTVMIYTCITLPNIQHFHRFHLSKAKCTRGNHRLCKIAKYIKTKCDQKLTMDVLTMVRVGLTVP